MGYRDFRGDQRDVPSPRLPSSLRDSSPSRPPEVEPLTPNRPGCGRSSFRRGIERTQLTSCRRRDHDRNTSRSPTCPTRRQCVLASSRRERSSRISCSGVDARMTPLGTARALAGTPRNALPPRHGGEKSSEEESRLHRAFHTSDHAAHPLVDGLILRRRSIDAGLGTAGAVRRSARLRGVVIGLSKS